ncbi:MAG: hypothetical protein GVY13_06760 [Alphaproteobacteria bacterium]|jgi:hypothetical protein|nr:hypothetical protein [Alphaproteobacteria bacterium]
MACTLAPPADGGRRSVALVPGQTLVIACDDAVPVLLIREGEALDIDFGLGGAIRLANAVPAAGMVPVPLIAGLDGPPLPLDRLAALLEPGRPPPLQGADDPFEAAALLRLPYGDGTALPALLDRTGLHPGVPAVAGVTPEPLPEPLPDPETESESPPPMAAVPIVLTAPEPTINPAPPATKVEDEAEPVPEPEILAAPPLPEADAEEEPAPELQSAPAAATAAAPPAPEPETAAESQPPPPPGSDAAGGDISSGSGGSSGPPAAAAPSGEAPDMVYGDALLDWRAGDRSRRVAAIRRGRRRFCEPDYEQAP